MRRTFLRLLRDYELCTIPDCRVLAMTTALATRTHDLDKRWRHPTRVALESAQFPLVVMKATG